MFWTRRDQYAKLHSYSACTTSATGGAGTDYPSGGPEFPLVLSRISVVRSLVFCVHSAL
jgi:hypothetical protein